MNLTFPEMSAILGVVSIIGGVLVKIFYKPDNTLKNNVEKLEDAFKHKQEMVDTRIVIIEERLKADYDDLYEIINSISKSRIKDIDEIKKSIDKLESKIEKLNDFLIQKLTK